MGSHRVGHDRSDLAAAVAAAILTNYHKLHPLRTTEIYSFTFLDLPAHLPELIMH